jgi:Family of unknown function (DUF6308)
MSGADPGSPRTTTHAVHAARIGRQAAYWGMTFLPGDDAVRDAASRIGDGLAAPGLRGGVAAYFDPDVGFAGMTFDGLGSNPPNEVTADDLLAVSLLDIMWQPSAIRNLLGAGAEKVSGMLAGISCEIDLWDASDADLATVDPLWAALLDMDGVGTATASKLLARKRPRLCPVSDRVVIRAADVPGRTWEVLRFLLKDAGARAAVERLRPPSAAGASLLRILDVAIWIRYSHSRAAHHLRHEAGITGPAVLEGPN